MGERRAVETRAYDCKACGVQFAVPETETVVCCPVCRMNRIDPVA